MLKRVVAIFDVTHNGDLGHLEGMTAWGQNRLCILASHSG
jgi:hypothetical protein